MIPKVRAKPEQPPFSAYELQMLRGCIGNLRGWHAGFTRKGEWYIRPARRVTTPRSPAQQAVAAKLKLAAQAWRELPIAEKDEYRRRAKVRRNIYPHHLFLREYLNPPEPPSEDLVRALEAARHAAEATQRGPKPVAPAAQPKQTPPAPDRTLSGSHCATPCSSVVITPLPHCMSPRAELRECGSCW